MFAAPSQFSKLHISAHRCYQTGTNLYVKGRSKMTNNTVVLASDHAYLWGCFLLIASMRKHGMPEPVKVLGFDYTQDDVACLKQLGDVEVHLSKERDQRSICCSKATAMLLPDTEYVTWADCDGMFLGNCSDRLTVLRDQIHIRLRSASETASVYRKEYASDDIRGTIPGSVLKGWCDDVCGRESSRLDSVCTSCFLSVHRDYRHFIRKWHEQINTVLPNRNNGVVDRKSALYKQTDESVLNSLLCFYPDAPKVAPDFQLDKVRPEVYVHFVTHPKPWVNWNRQSWPHYESIMAVLDWALQSGFRPPSDPIPKAFQRRLRTRSHLISRFSSELRRAGKIPNRLTSALFHG